MEILYYGIYPQDPNIRFIRQPDEKLLLIIAIKNNNSTTYIAYQVLHLNLNVGSPY